MKMNVTPPLQERTWTVICLADPSPGDPALEPAFIRLAKAVTDLLGHEAHPMLFYGGSTTPTQVDLNESSLSSCILEHCLTPSEREDSKRRTLVLHAKNGIQVQIVRSEDEVLPSTVSIAVPYQLVGLSTRPIGYKEMCQVFVAAKGVFSKTYYGKLSDSSMIDKYQETRARLDAHLAPETVYWMNYFGPRMTAAIGLDTIRNAGFHEVEECPEGGVLAAVQQEPLDESNQQHLQRKRELQVRIHLREVQAMGARFKTPPQEDVYDVHVVEPGSLSEGNGLWARAKSWWFRRSPPTR